MAFQKAGRAALRDAAEKATPMLLEPVDEVSILVPDHDSLASGHVEVGARQAIHRHFALGGRHQMPVAAA